METTQPLILTATMILLVAASGQIIARRTPIPLVLFYLAAGMLFGPAALGLLATHQLGELVPAIVRLAVAIIVFEGAFSLEGHYLRQVHGPVLNLVTIGLLVTALGGTLVGHWVAGLSWPLAIQYAALVSVTGPTVITPLLQRLRVNGRVRATLAGEGVIIDPIGAVFALVVFELIQFRERDLVEAVLWVTQRLALGAAWGVIGGLVLLLILRQLRDQPSQVARIMTLTGAVAIFTGIEATISESGLVAVVAAGLLLGNRDFPHREEVHRFKGDITLIVIATVYLLLAASIDPADLLTLGWRGVAAVLLMMLVVRPLGVFGSTVGSLLRPGERVFVAAIGPRGVVAASLATLISLNLEARGVPGATALLGLVFLTIAITIGVQASYAGWLAKRLGVVPMDILIIGAGRVGLMLAQEMIEIGEDVTVIEIDADRAEDARELGAHVVVGDGTDPKVLEKAGIENMKTVVAATASDKDNLLASQIAKTRYGRQHLVARVTDPEAVPSFEALGIQVMNPARATATILANLIRRPNIFRLLTEIDVGGVDVTEVQVGSNGIPGRALKELKLPADVLVLLVRRGDERVIPHGDTQLRTGDILTLVGSRRSTVQAMQILQG